MRLSVVIPSRNGGDILLRYLPGIIRETQGCGGEVIVVDDASSDNTREVLERNFPGVKVLRRSSPSGFPVSVNAGMDVASGGNLLVLNNDTEPVKGSFILLLAALEEADSNVAAAVPAIPRPDGTDDSLIKWGVHRGLAVTGEILHGYSYPSGACALWRREVWKELGGMDESYTPIYWEDADLGARMRNNGYGMIRVPKAVVRHMHASTMGSSSKTLALRERNRFLFMKKQGIRPGLWLPLHILSSILRGNTVFLRGYTDYLRMERVK